MVSLQLPATEAGSVGGLATIQGAGPRASAGIYTVADGAVLVGGGDSGKDDAGDPDGHFVRLENPVFGAGGFGFTGASVSSAGAPPVAGLWAELPAPEGESFLSQVAALAHPAPGVEGGQFAHFGAFALPRHSATLVYLAQLSRRAGITSRDDLGIWRQRPDHQSELLLRNGAPVQLGDGSSRTIRRLKFMAPVAHATDQRRSVASDGGVMAAATYQGGGCGLLRVAIGGGVEAPLESASAVPDLERASFTTFGPPATATGGGMPCTRA